MAKVAVGVAAARVVAQMEEGGQEVGGSAVAAWAGAGMEEVAPEEVARATATPEGAAKVVVKAAAETAAEG